MRWRNGTSYDAVQQDFLDEDASADYLRLGAVVIMKALSDHYDFSWAAALAAE
jgi:hypothetical protein